MKKYFALATLALGAGLLTGAGSPSGRPTASEPEETIRASTAVGDTIDLRRLGYDRGRPDAPVQVIEFSDFGCPYCAKFAQETYPALHREFVATGKVHWKHVPFVAGMFPNGEEAARAAECAAEQERFWPMHDLLYARQKEWKGDRAPETRFLAYAQQLQLDAGRFASCYRQDRRGARTRAHTGVADQLRLRATPSFYVNGRLVEGALPLAAFRQLLTAAASARGQEGR